MHPNGCTPNSQTLRFTRGGGINHTTASTQAGELRKTFENISRLRSLTLINLHLSIQSPPDAED